MIEKISTVILVSLVLIPMVIAAFLTAVPMGLAMAALLIALSLKNQSQ